MKIYRFLSVGILAISCAMPALGSTGGMSYRDYRAAQDENNQQLPEHTSRGALTGAGQMRRLGQRQDRETAQRIQGTILANNSLPTQANRDQWVRLFVDTYESPYVMSQLTQAQKEKYIEVISEFFKNAKLETSQATPADIEALYDKLSDRLQKAAAERLAPYLSSLGENRVKALESNNENTKRLIAKDKQLTQKLASPSLAPQERVVLEGEKKANDEQIAKSIAKGWSLTQKIIAGAATATALSLAYAGYKVKTGDVTTIKDFVTTAGLAGPRAAMYIGTAGYNMLPELKSLAPGALAQKAKGLWNRISPWGKAAPERVGEEAANPDLVDASGVISQTGQAWKRSSAAPLGQGIVDPELMEEPGQVRSSVVSDALSQSGQAAGRATMEHVQEFGLPELDQEGNLANSNVSADDVSNAASQAGQAWKASTPQTEEEVPQYNLFD